jgi:predicted GH43/DUF377 family glycosyl hydrolase
VTWRKRGLLIRPDPRLWWCRTHGMLPTPQPLGGSLFKVFFSGRDDRNRSHIGFAIVDLAEPIRVVDFSSEPVLAPGDLGCFDDNGVTPSSIVTAGGRQYLYYIGWNPGSTVRMHLFGGLALSDDGGRTFERYSRAPIIERSRTDPFLNTAPFVLHEGGAWQMFYVCGVGWRHKDLPRYHLRRATSADGLTWDRRGEVCVDFASDDENALARPWVVRDGDRYRMWFAHKGPAYRLGYAESPDGRTWTRDDTRAGLTVSASGWDADMVEYAAVVRIEGRSFMFYNGNGYGLDGIGLASSE